MPDTITGNRYLEYGSPVTVLARWRHNAPQHDDVVLWHRQPRSAPRNVKISREDGTTVVRPFRGLRKIRESGGA